MPASAAVEPALTFCTWAPWRTSAPSLLATSETEMPSRAWVGVSPLTISSTIGITSSMGIAKPRPIDPASPSVELAVRIEELMPTTLPFMSTSAPPLLPGLIAASVWMAGYVVLLPSLSEPTSTGRFRALTMPLVTVESRPNGEPIATTPSPTLRSADLPMVAGVRAETPSALMTAVSVSGSVPTTLALADEPSLKKTVIDPPSPAIAATWLLVRISPSELRMMPDPEPAPSLPLTSILTTDGSTLAATCSTEPSAAGESGVSTTWEVLWSLGLAEPPEASSSYAFQAAAPPTPAAPPTTSAVTTTAAARPARRRRFWAGRVVVSGAAPYGEAGGPSGRGPCGAGYEKYGFCGPCGGVVGWSVMTPLCCSRL